MEMGKLQSTPLKFGVAWISHPKVWDIGFYTLKFGSISKIPSSKDGKYNPTHGYLIQLDPLNNRVGFGF